MTRFIRHIRALRVALFGIPQTGCNHHWVTTEKLSVYRNPDEFPVAYEYILTCKKCGDMKKFKA